MFPFVVRQVIADFSAGYLSSDGGMLFLRQIDEGLGISRSLARCFYDARNPLFIAINFLIAASPLLFGVIGAALFVGVLFLRVKLWHIPVQSDHAKMTPLPPRDSGIYVFNRVAVRFEST